MFTAAAYGRVLGANDRIVVANIGCGRRNLLRELIAVKDQANIEIRAVCDTWRQRREKAAAQVKEHMGREPLQIVRFEDVLTMPEVDAVVIGTPDHLHARMLAEAARAGKDAYIEKPVAMNMAELIEAVEAVRQRRRIVQVGTQMRSYPQAAAARNFVTSGKLGKILKVEQARNGYEPYWQSYGREEWKEVPAREDVDWEAFLGERPKRPFDPNLYTGWYGYREFSRGPHTNLAVHFFDIVHYITGATIPRRVVALGGTYRWKSSFTAPDSVEVALEYPEDFMVRYCTIFGNSAGRFAKWFGTLGTLDAKNLSPREAWTVSGEGSGEEARIRGEFALPMEERVPHMLDWLQCLRTRNEPVAPIEAGYAHGVAVIMADEALVSGRRQRYDAGRRRIYAG